MAEAIVSGVLGQLTSLVKQQVEQEVKQVVGVDKEVKKLTSNLEAIQAVIIDAEQKQFKETSVGVWLEKLKHTSYDMEDVLDEWSTAMLKFQIEGAEKAHVPKKKVCNFFFSSHYFGFRQVGLRRDIAIKIKEINENLDAIAKQKDMYNLNVIRNIDKAKRVQSTSFVDVSEIYGRDNEKIDLVRKLCESSEERKGLNIISLVGMAGIGKTTLAQFAYNNEKVINIFEKRIWVCVSDPFDELRITRTIIESLTGSVTNSEDLENLLQDIHKSIMQKKFLLVLDDVWTEDYSKWEPFYNCLKNNVHGSVILITTRKSSVAQMMKSTHIITIEHLSDDENWSLFKQFAFFGRSSKDCENLEDIGRRLIVKCKGLPLAAKTIGSLLRFKTTREEWQYILDNEIWELEEYEKDILPSLLLSYNDLPSIVRRCFLYCAIFPNDHIISKDELIKLWMAQGYLGLEQDKELEIISLQYFNNLAARSFFQEFVKDNDGNIISCKMHDMVHDFAQFLSKKEYLLVEVNDIEEPTINSPSEKVRHAMLIFTQKSSFHDSMYNLKRLRSLSINNFSQVVNCSQALPKLIDQFTCLSALHIIGDTYFTNYLNIKEIPMEIGKMIHLIYLKLSFLDIIELPNTIYELCNLQTLYVIDCKRFERLPQGIEKLVNLRHLIFLDVSRVYIPKEISKLTRVRTLNQFWVSGSSHNGKACSLDCLKQLNHLRGSICINGLGNVIDVDEAKQAKLDNKKYLIDLAISFDEQEVRNEANEVVLKVDPERVLEALQLPPNLGELEIYDYKGITIFPNWIISLTNLKKLTIVSCMNCGHLPPLGKLPSLESLMIWVMRKVKSVGNEFLGLESDGASSSSLFTVFPKLKMLSFRIMGMWEVWDYQIRGKLGEENIAIMPCLNHLEIHECLKLKALPEHIFQSNTLKTLIIRFSPILTQRYKNGAREDWSKISHIPNIEIW